MTAARAGGETAPASIDSVQLLRALAALAVVAHHALNDLAALSGQARAYPWPLEAGVDLFFVISGFIMVRISGEAPGGRGDGAGFLIRRIARIVPPYWAASALYLSIVLAAPHLLSRPPPGAGEVVAAFLFVPVRGAEGLIQPIYPLGWTLNYEMGFYLLFAGSLLVRTTAPWRVALLAVVFGAFVAAGALFGPQAAVLQAWSDPIILEFVLGAAIGLMPVRVLRAVSGFARLALVFVALPGFALFGEGGPRVLAWGVPSALLVLAAVSGETALRGGVGRLAVALGDASYMIYLAHPFLLRPLRRVFASQDVLVLAPTAGGAAYLLLAMIGTAVVALFVYRWAERPVTMRLRDILLARLNPSPSRVR